MVTWTGPASGAGAGAAAGAGSGTGAATGLSFWSLTLFSFSSLGNSGSTAPSGAPGSSRPQARSAGCGSRRSSPSMPSTRPAARGMTGLTSAVARRMPSSRR